MTPRQAWSLFGEAETPHSGAVGHWWQDSQDMASLLDSPAITEPKTVHSGPSLTVQTKPDYSVFRVLALSEPIPDSWVQPYSLLQNFA